MHVELNDEQMKDLVSKAIFDSFTPEKRDELIQESIKSLITLRHRYPGDTTQTTPLGEMFDRAVRHAAEDLIKADLENDTTFKAEIQQLYHDSWNKAINDSEVREKLVDKIANSMGEALSQLGRY